MEEREIPVFVSPPSDPPPPTTVDSSTGVVFSCGDLAANKKRGRPRKYDADGNLTPGYKSVVLQPGYCFSAPSVEFPASKRGRGKHSASGGWKMSSCFGELFANTAGRDFTPHVVTVHTGEDVVAKIISFSQMAPRGVCVLSANGTVSNVTIRQPDSSGGLLTYEGRFEILSLKGSYTVSENSGMKSRTGGLSVSLASSDGRVIGGGLAGLLMADSPIQMVVASFVQDGFTNTQKRKKYYEPRKSPLTPASADTVIPATLISEVGQNINIYPISATQVRLQSHGEAHNNEARNHEARNNEAHNNETHDGVHYNEAHNNDDDKYMSDKQNPNTSSDSGEWNISDPNSAQRSYPDINVSLLVD